MAGMSARKRNLSTQTFREAKLSTIMYEETDHAKRPDPAG